MLFDRIRDEPLDLYYIKFDQSNFSLFDQYRADNKICFEVPFDSTSRQVVEVL